MKYSPEDKNSRKQLGIDIITKLFSCGFKVYQKNYNEIVFYREVDNTKNKVLVFTSVDKQTKEAKKCGTDAIRVCALDQSDRGICKATRVNRVGEIDDIVERMYQRMRKTYKEALDAYNIKCNKCGADTFLSRNGNRVCSDICWDKK